jgi:undecaprenyl phosphate N,N'-diacetylbacillosamine 1-phosphate transferase
VYPRFFKPAFDKVIAFVVLVAFSPLLLLTMLILALVNKGQPWFIQARPGQNEKIFKIIKFKTMSDARDADGNLLPDNERLSSFGKIVRKTSIDEIPQLINVLKGDMSLVGPRPLLPEYLPLYNADQRLRHMVKPGITGWAQVNGRNMVGWKERFAYDVWYVKNISFMLDVKILWLTIAKVFTGSGVSSGSFVTMEKFKGND